MSLGLALFAIGWCLRCLDRRARRHLECFRLMQALKHGIWLAETKDRRGRWSMGDREGFS